MTRDYSVASAGIHCGAVEVWSDTCYKNSTPSSLAGLLTTSDIQGIAMVDMSVLGRGWRDSLPPPQNTWFCTFYFSSKFTREMQKYLYLLEK